MLAGAATGEASSLRCHYNQDCYNCISGTRLEDCSLDCNVCTGLRCLGPGSPAIVDESPSPEPLQPLIRFSTERLGEAIHPDVARVFERFWIWYDAPLRKRDRLELAGGVVIDGKPHDFNLDVHQRGEAQVYLLDILEFGKVTLTARPAVEGRQELEFSLQRAGDERVRDGFIMLHPQ
jgi:hypothetical protein